VRTVPDADDLLLVLQPSGGNARKVFLHLAPGGSRARITTTARRFGGPTMVSGPARDLLRDQLADATLVECWQPAGERRCELRFRTQRGDRTLVLELFGSRGLWALLDAGGKVLAISRSVETAVRTVRAGDRYAAPPPHPSAAPGTQPSEPQPSESTSRFAAPVLAAIDQFFTAHDLEAEAAALRQRLLLPTRRALKKLRDKAQGLDRQLADAGRSGLLRAQADLMLAYAGTAQRGATELLVPDPDNAGTTLRIPLDPALPVVMQAQAIYQKARRLDDGRAIAERRRDEALVTIETLVRIEADLEAIAGDAADATARFERARVALEALGVVPKAERAPMRRAAAPVAREDNFRRFVSAEGYTILVGRDNQQNDRLTMRTANGNDLWLHVGGGRAGSHVVVRLPKQKTASLETLLDAATLAVHFSKARGEPRIDVVYTQRKHVRKPKGLPAGAVVPSQTKTVTVRLEEARLQRLLDSANDDAGS
jgi:predicted ribosome quality control (RQC) complex YloA/Tae2 family protein